MSDFYTLKENGETEWIGNDIVRWAKETGRPDIHNVATDKNEEFCISTIFLGVPHNFAEGEPLLFETMVFKQPMDYNDIDGERYTTKEKALEGHKKFVEKYISV